MKSKHLIIDILMIIIISGITNLIMNSFNKPSLPDLPDGPDTAYVEFQHKLMMNDAEIELLKLSIDSITSIQTSTNEKLKTIRAGRNRNNPVISSLSSAELTQLLSKRYADSLAGHAGANQ